MLPKRESGNATTENISRGAKKKDDERKKKGRKNMAGPTLGEPESTGEESLSRK